ncbi:hypothetical protein FOZ76_12710 [Verticiella sediminum]|uniref:Uncharacterized protein n=1 Tax=Verticiella sediminum TaxID=1247510 RepID=A0A556AMR6_9BURK|nr:hypothetical protein [Verticiella sediminum]TSH94171.1 hypothetical protein FOZ76_12710 [Verticiella sediminum]
MTDAPIDLDTASPARLREDGQLLRRTASRLAMPHLIRRVLIVIAGLVVFWIVARLILSAGATADYSRFGPPDAAAVAFLTRINMYIWWAVVAVLALITFFSLKSVWSGSVARENAGAVPADVLQGVAQQVSPPTLAVMRWVWADHSEPFSLGDLRRSAAELRGARVSKMHLVREQQLMLRAQLPAWNPRGGLSHGTTDAAEPQAAGAWSGRAAEPAGIAPAGVPIPPEPQPQAAPAQRRGEPFLGATPAGPASP